MAGFSPRTCHGGVLVWNNGSLDYTTTVNISNIPYSDFTVQAYVLDPTHLPGVSNCSAAETRTSRLHRATSLHPNRLILASQVLSRKSRF